LILVFWRLLLLPLLLSLLQRSHLFKQRTLQLLLLRREKRIRLLLLLMLRLLLKT
jgi:hypothetical protein